jgi:hypothetical protein
MSMKRFPQASISNISGRKDILKALQEVRKKYAELAQEWYKLAADVIIKSGHLADFIAAHPKDAARHMGFDWLLGAGIRAANNPVADGSIAKMIRGIFEGLTSETSRTFTVLFLCILADGPMFNLGRCKVCHAFFLRVRKDQKCCGRKCANLFRVRKWRERYQESYKAQRYGRAESTKGEELTCSIKEVRKRPGGIASGSAGASSTSRPGRKARLSRAKLRSSAAAS